MANKRNQQAVSEYPSRDINIALKLWKECFSYSDVAEQMNCSRTSVSRYVRKALKQQKTTPEIYAKRHMGKDEYADWCRAVSRGKASAKAIQVTKQASAAPQEHDNWDNDPDYDDWDDDTRDLETTEDNSSEMIDIIKNLINDRVPNSQVTYILIGISRYCQSKISNMDIVDLAQSITEDYETNNRLPVIKLYALLALFENEE